MKRGSLSGISHVLRDESGATAVFVALLLPVIFGMVVLTVDAGNLWQTRRDVITATDSTALSEARSAFLGESTGANCTTNWDGGSSLLETNADGTLSDTSCGVTRLPNDIGYATVRAKEQADLFFAPAIGLGDSSDVYSLSAAMFAYPQSFIGAAPLTFCAENDHFDWAPGFDPPWDGETAASHVLGYWKDASGTPSLLLPDETAIHRFYFAKDEGAECGESDGNWGWLDFDGPGGGSNDLADWLWNGYQGGVSLGGDISGETGAKVGGQTPDCERSIRSALDCLIESGGPIAVIIHSEAKNCSGNQCEYEVVSVIGMVLHCYYLSGGASDCPFHDELDAVHEVLIGETTSGQAERYFDFEFVKIFLDGLELSAAPPDGIDRGARSIKLCGMDHDLDSNSGTTDEDDLVALRCTPN